MSSKQNSKEVRKPDQSKPGRFTRLKNRLKNQLESWMNRNPRKSIGGMFAILVLGLVFVLLRRSTNTQDRTDTITDFADAFYDSATYRFEPVPSISDYTDLLKEEDRINEILKKDTLSHEDSLYLKSINEKLNKIIKRNVED